MLPLSRLLSAYADVTFSVELGFRVISLEMMVSEPAAYQAEKSFHNESTFLVGRLKAEMLAIITSNFCHVAIFRKVIFSHFCRRLLTGLLIKSLSLRLQSGNKGESFKVALHFSLNILIALHSILFYF